VQIRHIVFEKQRKNAPLIPKNASLSRKLGYFHNQLKSC